MSIDQRKRDRRTMYPQNGRALLDWYRGAFDAAFIALHPFRDPLPMASDAQALLSRAGLAPNWGDPFDLVTELYKQGRAKAVPFLDIFDVEKRHARPISWEDARSGAGFSDLAAVNHALLSGIFSLRTEVADQAGSERLRAFCDRQRWFVPTEGSFQCLMEQGIANLFTRAGVEAVETVLEFGEDPMLLGVPSLRGPASWRHIGIHTRGSIYAVDRSLLVAVHWDSFFTLVTGTHDRLAAADPASLFEGFWCSPTTSHHWWEERAGWTRPSATVPR
jgi:hypothetical protein